MENEKFEDSARSLRRTMVTAVVGSFALSCTVFALPSLVGEEPPPAPGPVGRAMEAVGAGAPASLADLGALIADREAHLAAHPGDEESWAVLGGAYVEHGRRTADHMLYTRAERALKRSVELRPAEEGNVEALTGMAALAHARHDYRAAKRWGEQAAEQAPKRWTVYPVLIDAYDRIGHYKAADKALDTLQELRSDAAVRARAARLYAARGWLEMADAAVADAAALAEGPAERAAHQHAVGELAWERGETRKSLRWFEAALRTDPEHHPALAGRARALAALGRTENALAAYRDVLRRLPLPRYAVELGELYDSLEMQPEAEQQYESVRRRLREAGHDQVVLGLFEADHGEPEEAVRRLAAEYRRHPGRRVTDALGWAYFRAGDGAKALRFAKKAMAKEAPRSALFAYHRGQIERGLDNPGAARRFLTEALKLNPHFSPLHAPAAEQALEALGEPPPGGPVNVTGEKPRPPSPGKPGGAQAEPAKPGKPRKTSEPRKQGGPSGRDKPRKQAEPSARAEPSTRGEDAAQGEGETQGEGEDTARGGGSSASAETKQTSPAPTR
ncbi:hypothetical protein [Streptomyces sp. KLOTTS4A1]|uniref:tetratricopeptide repeat protein n=1 Tax=Streptomyces sp. KLOTTS4A1 TaxID=3390996 RepID=UPI0039F4E3C5